MKRFVAGSVVGVFLLTSSALFASDKTPIDSTAGEPANSVAAPAAKAPEALKAGTTSQQDTSTSVTAPAAKGKKGADKASVAGKKSEPSGLEGAKTVAPAKGASGKHAKAVKHHKPAEKTKENGKQQGL